MGLLYNVKYRLMMSEMKKKRATTPFDGVTSDLFQLPATAGPLINNSYFFGGNNPDGQSLIMRVGYRNIGSIEIFVIYCDAAGRFFTIEEQSYKNEESPVTIECVTPEKLFHITFNGRMRNMADGTIVSCKFDIEYIARLPIFDALQHSDFRGMAQAFARAKWNKAFFKEMGGDTGMSKEDKSLAQRHYEQTGRLKGNMTLGDEQIVIDMPGVRDHSYGKRDWNYMCNHIWLLAVTEKGEVFNFSIVNYPSVKRIFCGYSDFKAKENYSMVGYDILSYDHNDGMGPDEMTVVCSFDNGRMLRVTAKRVHNVLTPFDGGNFYFQEGVGDFIINGTKARGSIEYGFNKDKSRWGSYKED